MTAATTFDDNNISNMKKKCKVGNRREMRLERLLRESMRTIRKQKETIKRLEKENLILRGGGLLDGVTSEASSIDSSDDSIAEIVESVSDLLLLPTPKNDVKNVALRKRVAAPPTISIRSLGELIAPFSTPARILPSYKGKEEFLFRSENEKQFASWADTERLRRIHEKHPHLSMRHNSMTAVEQEIEIGELLPQPTGAIQQQEDIFYSSEDEAMIGWC